jgi:methionine aminotransferase
MSALAAQHQAINLSQGFPNYDPPAELRALVNEHLESGHNQYAPMPGLPELRQALATKHHTTSGKLVDFQTEITITAGATQAIFTAITCLVHPGDEVIVFEPAYDSYRPAAELCGATVISYPLQAPDFRVDWDAFAALLTDRTRLIVLNTPHNPTGTIWQKKDWQQLEQLVADRLIYILSDEVYEQLIYDEEKHYSLLDFPNLYNRGFATYSFGKTFHATGWKTGYCIGPPELMTEFRKVHQFNVFAVNTPMQYALAEYLQDPASYNYLSRFYQRKRDFFLSLMEGSSLQPLACQGTYFQLFDYSAISKENDVDFSRWLTEEIGVAAIPVSAFSSEPRPEEKLIRLCFAKTEEVLGAAADRLRRF